MFTFKHNDREVTVDNIHGKYDDDIQFDVYYTDTEEDVGDDVASLVYDQHYAQLYEHWFENKLGEADHLMDMMKEGY